MGGASYTLKIFSILHLEYRLRISGLRIKERGLNQMNGLEFDTVNFQSIGLLSISQKMESFPVAHPVQDNDRDLYYQKR